VACNNDVPMARTELGYNMLLPLRANKAQQNFGLVDGIYCPKSKCKDLAQSEGAVEIGDM
jgi:hypothetical protein